MTTLVDWQPCELCAVVSSAPDQGEVRIIGAWTMTLCVMHWHIVLRLLFA